MQSSKEWQGEIRNLLQRSMQREEKNKMGKTRDLFMKISDTKEIFHSKMGSKKDKNGMDLTKAEDIEEEVATIHGGTIQKRST